MMPQHHCSLIRFITIIITHCHHHHAGKQVTGDDTQIIACPVTVVNKRVRCRRCHCRNHHHVGEQGTGDDAEASLLTIGNAHKHRCSRCCRCHYCAGKRGTGGDAAASSPALLPSLTCTSVHAATVTAVAIAWASKRQGMMPRHHHPFYHCC